MRDYGFDVVTKPRSGKSVVSFGWFEKIIVLSYDKGKLGMRSAIFISYSGDDACKCNISRSNSWVSRRRVKLRVASAQLK